jgi:hypothetical protein
MKIFYSWQNDLERKHNRGFIKGALEKVVRQLNVELSIEEPERQVELDHDTMGVPGTPDLANTIFDKIAESTVFVADVSFIAERAENNRKLSNPNVLIELGYAFSKLGSDKVVCVMNTAYGKPDDLPFDLKHKRHPVQYSSTGDLKSAKEDLVKSLKAAIALIIRQERYKKSKSTLSATTVQGWIEKAIRPSVLSLKSVKQLLTQDKVLTWRYHGCEFDGIRQSKDLAQFAQDTLEHFTEHHPDVNAKLALYDQQRAELSAACQDLHKALMANPRLYSIYEEAKANETVVNGRTIASDFDIYEKTDHLESLAESIVNRRHAESYGYVYERSWRWYRDEFVALRDHPDISPESERVDRAGENLSETVEELIPLMTRIGKRLAEEHGGSY